MKNFSGKVLFLDRDDINTDEIIPARYLTESTKEALQPFLLEDLEMEEFDPAEDLKGKQIVITRANFGCGSSREHAPWALEVNGIHMVIAESFARIFRQNMFNCGMLAVELPAAVIDELFRRHGGPDTRIETDLGQGQITVTSPAGSQTIDIAVSDFDRQLVETGGWVEFADSKY